MEEHGLRRVFDLGLKLDLVGQIEKGHLKVSEVCKLYRVSHTSVYKWLYKYSDIYQKQTRVIVENKSIGKKHKELQGRIEELERTLGQKQMRIDYLEKLMEVVSDRMGEDIEKKNKGLS
ncbi:IS630 transposase-related protein [Sinomicrobium sp. M5D2P9]